MFNPGAIERPKDERDFLLGSVQAPVSIPASYIPDVSWLVRNYQGQTPCCSAHAYSHFQAILEHQITPTVNQRYTPRFSWIEIKQIDGYPLESGTDMRSIFKVAQATGTNDFEPLENDVTLPITTYSEISAVTPAMVADASAKKINSYVFGNTDFESLCQYVYQNKAVLLLIKVDNGFWGSETPTFTIPEYGHFICAYGYDENYLYIVDSADPEFGFKKIAKQYITPTFFFESGTAIDISPTQIQQLVNNAATLSNSVVSDPTISDQQKVNFLTSILASIKGFFK